MHEYHPLQISNTEGYGVFITAKGGLWAGTVLPHSPEEKVTTFTLSVTV